jgi:HD-GYP domain-containing protein (c-di-GMP phosphodiesterase class II)
VGTKRVNKRDYVDHIRTRVLLFALDIIEIHEHSINTVQHSDRVGTVTNLMGRELNLPERELAVLWRASLLHDLGKIGVPIDILKGRKKLSNFDRNVVDNHPKWGHNTIKVLGFFNYEASIIKQHHENFDGTGYPDGLKGKDIHLFARMIRVVDVYDALTAFRTYRPQWFPNRAAAYIIKNSGTLFDPEIVSLFLKIRESERFKSLYF